MIDWLIVMIETVALKKPLMDKKGLHMTIKSYFM